MMTNILERLSGQELQKEITNIKNDYNTYTINLDEAKSKIKDIVDVLNNRAIEVAKKYNKAPYLANVTQFIKC